MLRFKVVCHCLYTVSLSSPWQNVTYIPHNSETYINCTGEGDIYWLVHLSGLENPALFGDSDETLHQRGFYGIPTLNSATLSMVINMTEGNNGTVIRCIDSYSSEILSETTMITIGISNKSCKHYSTVTVILFSVFKHRRKYIFTPCIFKSP